MVWLSMSMLVTEWMSHDPITLAPEDSLARAAETMARRAFRRIPIGGEEA